LKRTSKCNGWLQRVDEDEKVSAIPALKMTSELQVESPKVSRLSRLAALQAGVLSLAYSRAALNKAGIVRC
jgi:hypothetical protein